MKTSTLLMWKLMMSPLLSLCWRILEIWIHTYINIKNNTSKTSSYKHMYFGLCTKIICVYNKRTQWETVGIISECGVKKGSHKYKW